MTVKPVTILLVEDNRANVMVFRDLLEAEGYHVDCVNNGEDAVAAATELEPTLILMDIQLPGMDGLTATRILREDKKMRNVPIIALTSYAMPGDREKFLVAGCSGYIKKPIRVKEFRKEIAAVVETLEEPRKLEQETRELEKDHGAGK